MRKGGELRGSNKDRRRRKEWMLATFDPHLGPDLVRCRLELSDRCLGLLDYPNLTVDRIDMGGRYTRDNCQPACAPCQHRQGGLATLRGMAELMTNYYWARDHWITQFDLHCNQSYYPGVIAVERRKEKRGGRREVTDWIDENPPPVFREWLAEWHAANREQREVA